MTELSQSTKKLIQRYQAWYQLLQPREPVPTIHVDEVASAVAAFYEKIREVVDWREEHLMRRAAIERVVKRRLFLFNAGPAVAEPMVLELIRGGHFPNDRIPEFKIKEIQEVIDKYTYILENAPLPPKEKMKVQLYDWLLGIAACEIEEILAPALRERALIEYMAEEMIEKIEVRKITLSDEEKVKQIYIAVQKALFKLDYSFIAFSLLKKKYSQWSNLLPTDSKLNEITNNIYSIWQEIENYFRHPLVDKFYRICERYDTPYLILGDIVSEEPLNIEEKIKAPEELEKRTTAFYQKRLRNLKNRVGRAAIYATLSIFLSKILLALAIELPFDRYLLHQFNYFNLGLNVLIPPFLMFFLILTIRPPSKENLQQVIIEVMKIAYQKERKESYLIEASRKRGWLTQAIITFFYTLAFFASFGIIILGLRKLNFSVLSIIIFIIFVSLIAFAGVKIRERSRELEVIKKKEYFLTLFVDFFSLPIVQAGKWLSHQWARYNILVILLNFLIELPFQSFIEFLEHWREFLKEKKEEIH